MLRQIPLDKKAESMGGRVAQLKGKDDSHYVGLLPNAELAFLSQTVGQGDLVGVGCDWHLGPDQADLYPMAAFTVTLPRSGTGHSGCPTTPGPDHPESDGRLWTLNFGSSYCLGNAG
jgi:hypothetical protein